MKIIKLSLLALSSLITVHTAFAQSSTSSDVACITIDQSISKKSPEIILKALENCLKNSHIKKAVYLFKIAQEYAAYDNIVRAKNPEASRYITSTMRRIMSSVTPEQETDFVIGLQQYLGSEPDSLKKVCSYIRKAGPPTYKVSYVEEKREPKQAFNNQLEWEKHVDKCLNP